MKRAMKLTKLIAVGLAALAVSAPAHAQLYKGKTITMIVNYPPGGPTDIEGRIVAQHLPDHIPGHPNVVVKNIGGAAGLIGANQLGDAIPNGETIGFFTMEIVAQVVGNPAIRTRLSDFALIAGVESPLVVYMRKDTPPGVNVAADLMKTKDFKALSLNAQNFNTINMSLALDLLGIKYQPIPAYIGLKEVETAILQNTGQMADTSLSGWTGSIEPSMGNIVIPLWQLSAPGENGTHPRSRALPNVPTFEEFYASVMGGKAPSGDLRYEVLRSIADPQLAMFRVAMMPPKTPDDTVAVMRTAFSDLWQDPQFLADYSKVEASEPILVSGREGQKILAALGKIRPEIKDFLIDYSNRMTAK
jgi:tripartite-type tricarboxylate transporter receptor subunit TctC